MYRLHFWHPVMLPFSCTVSDVQTDRQTDGWTDGQIEGPNRQTEGWTGRPMERAEFIGPLGIVGDPQRLNSD